MIREMAKTMFEEMIVSLSPTHQKSSNPQKFLLTKPPCLVYVENRRGKEERAGHDLEFDHQDRRQLANQPERHPHQN